jgi:hypothetical protein
MTAGGVFGVAQNSYLDIMREADRWRLCVDRRGHSNLAFALEGVGTRVVHSTASPEPCVDHSFRILGRQYNILSPC